jgi:hypothetical protein
MQKDLAIVILSEGGKISTKVDPHPKSGYENYRKGGRCQYYDKALRKKTSRFAQHARTSVSMNQQLTNILVVCYYIENSFAYNINLL